MTNKHDYAAAIAWWENFQSGDWDNLLFDLSTQETIQSALRLSERLQSGDITQKMSSVGKYVLKGSVDESERRQALSVFKAMVAQLLKEIEDDR